MLSAHQDARLSAKRTICWMSLLGVDLIQCIKFKPRRICARHILLILLIDFVTSIDNFTETVNSVF